MTPFHRRTTQAVCGFTLIELVVTVLIMAILGVMAMSAYQSEVQKGRRTEAKNALLDIAGREETYYSTNNIYSTTPTDLGYTGGAFPITVGSGYYSVAAAITAPVAPTATTPGTPAGYTLVATPLGSQVKDTTCASLSVNQAGLRTSLNSGGGNTTTTCW